MMTSGKCKAASVTNQNDTWVYRGREYKSPLIVGILLDGLYVVYFTLRFICCQANKSRYVFGGPIIFQDFVEIVRYKSPAPVGNSNSIIERTTNQNYQLTYPVQLKVI
jgi:hypothetical protein